MLQKRGGARIRARKQIMATEATLPVVGCLQLTRKRGGNVTGGETGSSRSGATRNEEVAAFLASVRLGSLERAPRPGDVFRPSRHGITGGQRPLGLIPGRRQVHGTFLPPLYPAFGGVMAAQQTEEADDRDLRRYDDGGATFRFMERDGYSRRAPSAAVSRTAMEDGEYTDTLAKCKMQDYITTSEVYVPQKFDANAPYTNRHRRSKTVPETGTKLHQYSHTNVGPTEYFSFINQASMTRKMLYLDQRRAAECRECERCRGRRGRCPRCLAIRVGGGYIILDGGELPEHRRRYGAKDQYQLTGGLRSEMEGNTRNKNGFGLGTLADGANTTGYGGGGGGGGEGGGRGGWEGGGGGRGGGGKGLGGWSGEGGFGDGSGMGAKGEGNYGGGRGDGDELNKKRDGQDGNAVGGSELWDGSGVESGRQSNVSGQRPSSRMTGSRPASPRPPSSMRRLGGSRGGDRRKGVNFERESGGGGRKREGDGEGGEDDDENDKRNRRRRKGGREGEDDEDDSKGERYGYGYSRDEDDLEAPRSGSLGDLMRFKSKKRDDVKVLKATLKELKDIDPLDYLARYCIIDQEKVPHYRRVYDNVDRDEDDEIDILELDFALKAVNFDLISDSELSYVNSVLELAGRHKLNFRLFSLIAALSEKVVALDDMVKRLINKMDFEALEVKLKKCKELFYLLADSEHERVEQGGVVTVSSLAVELQAGGLTQEHVEYVCDHMNHEDRGLVEFLDYLTYVPLFVEIHDTIYDNPLDFTRTK